MAFEDVVKEISLQGGGSPGYGNEVKRYDAFPDMFKLADAITKYQKTADSPVPRGTPTLQANNAEFDNLLGLLGTSGKVTTDRQAELFGLNKGWTIPVTGGGGGGGGASSGKWNDSDSAWAEQANAIIQRVGSAEDRNSAIDMEITGLKTLRATGLYDPAKIDQFMHHLWSLREGGSGDDGGGGGGGSGFNIINSLLMPTAKLMSGTGNLINSIKDSNTKPTTRNIAGVPITSNPKSIDWGAIGKSLSPSTVKQNVDGAFNSIMDKVRGLF